MSDEGDLCRRLRDAAQLMNKGHAVFVPDLLIDAAWEIENRRVPSAAFRAGAEAMREKAADKADAMADSWDADWRAERKASTHLEGKSDGAVEIAAAIRDLPLPAAQEDTL